MLLLDEPFSALDQPTREALLEELAAVLAETGVTTVFVTHDRDEALRLGDRVAVLMGGRLRQVGPAAEVFAAPVDEEVAAFVGVETIVPAGAVGGGRPGALEVAGVSSRPWSGSRSGRRCWSACGRRTWFWRRRTAS